MSAYKGKVDNVSIHYRRQKSWWSSSTLRKVLHPSPMADKSTAFWWHQLPRASHPPTTAITSPERVPTQGTQWVQSQYLDLRAIMTSFTTWAEHKKSKQELQKINTNKIKTFSTFIFMTFFTCTLAVTPAYISARYMDKGEFILGIATKINTHILPGDVSPLTTRVTSVVAMLYAHWQKSEITSRGNKWKAKRGNKLAAD